jgi:virulence-associated protein VagC
MNRPFPVHLYRHERSLIIEPSDESQQVTEAHNRADKENGEDYETDLRYVDLGESGA